MRRDVSLEEISDGKLYGANDMVKAELPRIAQAAVTAAREWGIHWYWILWMCTGLAAVLGEAVRNWAAICMDFDVADGTDPASPSDDRKG